MRRPRLGPGVEQAGTEAGGRESGKSAGTFEAVRIGKLAGLSTIP